MEQPESATPAHQPIGTVLTLAMSIAAGVAVANIYYNQPMLGLMEQELPDRLTTLVPTATQLGYAAGLILLVPLGDLIERKRLIVLQFLALALALAAAATAPSSLLLALASLLVGAAATVAQQIVPFAVHLAAPQQRGAVVGKVMAGLLCGILLSRTLSGLVASYAGWREMFWLGVPMALATGAWMAIALPRSLPDSALPYRELMRSLIHLWRAFSPLRKAAVTQALLFASFSVFWTILAFHLAGPDFGLGAAAAGLFGIIGVVGVVAAPISGRIADKHGPGWMIMLGTTLALVSWLVFGAWGSLAGMVVGVILLDFGAQATLISNQHIVYALDPAARARLNTIFMSAMFLGGAIGSAAATQLWAWGGWPAVVVLGALFSATAIGIQIAGRHKASP